MKLYFKVAPLRLFHFARSDIVKATMPMYSADMEIIQKVVKIAKEVFR